eukprot:354745-Chlamydomonas_euryale.AAC.3
MRESIEIVSKSRKVPSYTPIRVAHESRASRNCDCHRTHAVDLRKLTDSRKNPVCYIVQTSHSCQVTCLERTDGSIPKVLPHGRIAKWDAAITFSTAQGVTTQLAPPPQKSGLHAPGSDSCAPGTHV